MNKPSKWLSIVAPICVVLSGIVLLLCMLEPEFIEVEAFMILTTVLLTVWAFFIVPSFIYALTWLMNYFADGGDDFASGFARGFRFGYLWADLFFVLMILGAPVSGTLWFIDTIKAIKRSDNGNQSESERSDDVFDV